MHGRSADTSLAELFDKHMNVQKECLKKNFWGSCKPLQAHKTVCDEKRIKMFLMEGKSLAIRCIWKSGENDFNEL